MNRRSSRDGFVLVAVLWLLAIFTVVALGYARATRFRSQELVNEAQLVREDSVFRSALDLAEFHFDLYRRNRSSFLATEERLAPGLRSLMWYPRHETYALEVDGRELFVRLEHIGGRMALGSMSQEMWFAVLGACGVKAPSERSAIVGAILDWQDADSLLHVNGAEQEQYDAAAPPYMCKNAPLESLEELMLVRGVTPGLFHGDGTLPGLRHFLTLEGKNSRLDVNCADPAAFRIVEGITDEEIALIVKARRRTPFVNMVEVSALLAFATGEEMGKYFHVLGDTDRVRAIVSPDPDPDAETRVGTKIVNG